MKLFLCDRHEPGFCFCVCMSSKDLTASRTGRNSKHEVRFDFSFFVFALLSAASVYVSPRPPSSVRCGSHGATASAFRPPSSIRCGSHGATAVAFQGIPFVAATNGVFVRVRVCACLCAILNTIRTIANHSSSEFQKLLCNTQGISTATNGRTSSERHIGSYLVYLPYVSRNSCDPLSTCDTPGISSQPQPEGEFCTI